MLLLLDFAKTHSSLEQCVKSSTSTPMKQHILVLLVFCVSTIVLAQPTTELGLYAGRSLYLGDLESEDLLPDLSRTTASYGIHAAIALHYNWSVRATASFHQLKGDDAWNSDEVFQNRGFSFDTDLIEGSLQLVWEPFAHKRYPKEGGYKRILSPYAFVGVGFASFDPTTDFGSTSHPETLDNIRKDKTTDIKPSFVIPVGAGIRYDLNTHLSLGLELSPRRASSDYLDGISHAGLVNNDWYIAGGVHVAYRWYKSDYDRDGFLDTEDECPQKAGLSPNTPCPDSDGDGVSDDQDQCPYQKGASNAKGCPDSDYDGIADFVDDCPDTPGHSSANGCKDSDGDGTIDAEDMCPYCPGKDLSGCPDTDGDGVEDSRDRCPNLAGDSRGQGCPFQDQDGDGIADKDDRCPNIKGLHLSEGCPDQDFDGINDSEDRCPTLAGNAEHNGCPEASEELKASLARLTEAVQFETGSNQLKQSSKEKLQELVHILNEYPFYHLSITGHTDSKGNDQSNLRLSQKRAEACYLFLTKNDIAASRLQHAGKGETEPIADNNSAEGRAKNRRVAFELHIP